MSYPNFTVEMEKLNKTTSCFRLPKRLIGKDAIKDVRVALIKAIRAERVCAVQACLIINIELSFPLPPIKWDMISMALIFVL